MKIKGQIIKNISDNFEVSIDEKVITCKCRGKFRNNKQTLLVGDFVLIDENSKTIEELLPRKNELIRPRVSNITQGLIITSFKNPDFSTNLLDKFITLLEINHIKPVICLTKKDLITNDFNKFTGIIDYYKKIGYAVVENTEVNKIKKLLENNVTVFMGQTGAGKSTLLNKLFEDLNLKTGEISLALGRGRHTTRHIEIFLKDNMKVLDTPGFSALDFLSFSRDDIKNSFREFSQYSCKYSDCMHLKEEDCLVKEAVERKEILLSRYLNYKSFIEEFDCKGRLR